MIRLRAATTLGLLLGMTVACEEEFAEDPAPTPGKPAVSKAASAAPPSAPGGEPPVPVPEYSYSPVGKRDPFRSYLAERRSEEKNVAQRKLLPTEMYDIDQFRLTGLILGSAQPRAMVEDPSGAGHALVVGSRVGKNGGRVSRISGRNVVIVEETRDATGQVVRVPITLQLKQDDLEGVLKP